ncbi:MAG: FAD-binding oxidoreductase, partial [Nitrospirae bacterium]|nr:FAD-binding oxidoreductase [Nitrospirota bacterium]
MDKDLINDLASILPEGSITAVEEELVCYGSDATRVFARPDVVVRPTDADAIPEVMIVAARHGMPVVPRGAGT